MPDLGHDDPITVFVSYAHRDRALVEEIVTAIEPLACEQGMEIWYDDALTGGDDFTEEIERKLGAARLVLLMVTPGFLSSVWVGKEVRRALSAHAGEEARVVPIILEECDWKNSIFGGLLALPNDGAPLARWTDRDAGVSNILVGIAKAAGRIRAPAPSPDLCLFTPEDLREMIQAIEQAIAVIKKSVAIYVPPPANSLIQMAQLEGRRDELRRELIVRGELR